MARRVTNHSARKHKNGKVFSRKHPDRNFNTGKDKHIDPSLSHLNTYWKNPDLNIGASTFDEFEQIFYESRFSEHIDTVNAKHEKSRHYERMIDATKLRNSSRTCVEETLLYFGDKDNPLPNEEFDQLMTEYVAWHKEQFPQCVILDYAIHRDEPLSAQHAELATVWCAVHDNGYLYPNQTKALEQMGIENNDQKRDNAKKIYSEMCRAKQAELLISHGYAVELTPKEKSGQGLEEFKRDKAIEERKEQEKFIIHEEDKTEILSKIRPNKFNKNEVVMPKELADQLVASSLERDKYALEYTREKKRKDDRIDREKMDLRIQLHREREAHRETRTFLQEIKAFTEKFLGEHNLLQSFQARFKRYREDAERYREYVKELEQGRSREHDEIHHHRR